jgi:adenylylsulfate kinase-like enzyme
MIVLFCGIPGSGKTTVAEALEARASAVGSVQVLSSDKLRSPVYKKIFRALAPERRAAELVILDATFFKKELRHQLKALVFPEKVIIVYLDCPLAVALERNRARLGRIAEKAVYIVYHRMEPPAHPSLTIDTTTLTPAEAAERILQLMTSEAGVHGKPF